MMYIGGFNVDVVLPQQQHVPQKQHLVSKSVLIPVKCTCQMWYSLKSYVQYKQCATRIETSTVFTLEPSFTSLTVCMQMLTH